ncbi:hypothetical protein BDP27DRAFT_1318154 [Rhodocollybia butyracea]|uniref:Uncharacterized protein n=1 Tax=Rhodocollybia butyracea TaxID=206335 RepID=A0A9P5UB69_9AGAR|nr:hypothetical protein BDP27DRAFT_1318154 [Rhodocollybia butyracea]
MLSIRSWVSSTNVILFSKLSNHYSLDGPITVETPTYIYGPYSSTRLQDLLLWTSRVWRRKIFSPLQHRDHPRSCTSWTIMPLPLDFSVVLYLYLTPKRAYRGSESLTLTHSITIDNVYYFVDSETGVVHYSTQDAQPGMSFSLSPISFSSNGRSAMSVGLTMEVVSRHWLGRISWGRIKRALEHTLESRNKFVSGDLGKHGESASPDKGGLVESVKDEDCPPVRPDLAIGKDIISAASWYRSLLTNLIAAYICT